MVMMTASQGHGMYFRDLEVMGSNPVLVGSNLGCIVLPSKSYLNLKNLSKT